MLQEIQKNKKQQTYKIDIEAVPVSSPTIVTGSIPPIPPTSPKEKTLIVEEARMCDSALVKSVVTKKLASFPTVQMEVPDFRLYEAKLQQLNFDLSQLENRMFTQHEDTMANDPVVTINDKLGVCRSMIHFFLLG